MGIFNTLFLATLTLACLWSTHKHYLAVLREIEKFNAQLNRFEQELKQSETLENKFNADISALLNYAPHSGI